MGDALVHAAALATHEAGAMIGHRDGHTVTICDGCYRPRRLVGTMAQPVYGDSVVPYEIISTRWEPEPGWEHSDEGGLPEAPARAFQGAKTPPEPHPIPVRSFTQPEQGLDYCPECVAQRTGTATATQTGGWHG